LYSDPAQGKIDRHRRRAKQQCCKESSADTADHGIVADADRLLYHGREAIADRLGTMNTYRTGPQTDRLLLRAMTVDDADALFAINSDPDVMRYTHEPMLSSTEEARQAIADYPDFDSVGFGRWGCVLKESHQVIGFCGLKYLDDLDVVDVGYRLLREYWGRGLATEACRASIQFGFDVLQLERIVGLVLPENHRSIRVLEKAGLNLEEERRYEDVQVLFYGIHRESWQKSIRLT
jgi:RimJ/RimL family protein N-acetyltransferase